MSTSLVAIPNEGIEQNTTLAMSKLYTLRFSTLS
jgi:hypothetical protein